MRIPETRWTYGIRFVGRRLQSGVTAEDHSRAWGQILVWVAAWDSAWGFWFTDHRRRAR